MKLTKIEIKRLFDMYDYSFSLLNETPITIIHAPNGRGKTTILNLIKSILDVDSVYLKEIPFESVKLVFSDNNQIKVDNSSLDLSYYYNDEFIGKLNGNIFRRYLIEFYKDLFQNKKLDRHDLDAFQDLLSENNSYKDYFKKEIRNYYSHSIEDFNKSKYDFDVKLDESSDLIREKLKNINESLKTYFIEANRLYLQKSDKEQTESILKYSNDIKKRIAECIREKERISEELDRTFPKRLIEIIYNKNTESTATEENTWNSLYEIEQKRMELSRIGLVENTSDQILPDESKITTDTADVLKLYAEDYNKKLAVYDDLKAKLEIFLQIINEKHCFSNKKMIIHEDQGFSFQLDNGKEIPLNKLSSGEKNDFILFYELIFNCSENTLVMIDEPEISQHITWQEQFIDDLRDICNMNHLQAIVATHSPDIVGEHWDLVCDIADTDESDFEILENIEEDAKEAIIIPENSEMNETGESNEE